MSDQPNEPEEETGSDAAEVARPLEGALLPLGHRELPRRPAAMGMGQSAAADRGSPSSGGGLSGYLHAFRRRWFLAILLGIIGGGLAASVAWVTGTTTYTSSALIHISADEQRVAFKIDDTRSSFDIYKGTQMQFLTQDFVLNAALRQAQRKLPNMEILKKEEDPLRWLAKSLQIENPGNAELLRLSLTTVDKDEVVALVQAVGDAYKTEVVDVERTRRAKRLEDLDRVYTDKESEMRTKRTELKRLAGQLGSGDMGALSIKQQITMQQFAESRNELVRLRGELKRARDAFDAKLAAIKARHETPVSASEIENAANLDSVCLRLQDDLAGIDSQLNEVRSTIREKSTLATPTIEKYTRIRKTLEEQLAARRKQLTEHLKTLKSGESDTLETDAKELQRQIALLTEQEQQAAKDLETQKKQTEMFGNSSIEVEMMRAEIQELEKVLTTVADERQKLQVELGSEARIKVMSASTPTAPDKSSRLQNIIVSGVFGFLTPVCLLLWWDVCARRINSLSDISTGLGLRVIGTVPHIDGSPLSRIRPDSRRQRRMQICLDHSIDGIAAKLFLRRDSQNARVVLVSSATRGEGKSTLSIQLAKRLALTGAKTLLVDFDLRKPSLHHVFDMQRGPGLSEFLRGESELGPIVRQTPLENLSILTAGSPFADSLGSLSNGVTRSLFETARGEYEFVVVDGSPILPVVDALLTSQHVDSVVLSVRRDVSQAPRVQAACEQLAAFGVEEFVAVLTGSNEDLYYYGDPEHVERDYVGQALGEKQKPR